MPTRLADLLTRIQKADPEDETRQVAILRDLKSFRDELGATGSPVLVRYIDAAALLISYQLKLGSVGGDVVKSLLGRVLRLAAVAQGAGDLPLFEEPEDATGARGRLISNLLLGEILLRRGEIRPEDEQAALALQQQTGMRFGEALVKLGATTWAEVEDALGYQDRCRHVVENFVELAGVDERVPGSKRPSRDVIAKVRAQLDVREAQPAAPALPSGANGKRDTRVSLDAGLQVVSDLLLGEILMRKNIVTRAQLETALGIQRATGVRVGEALVQSGALSWGDLDFALRLQGEMRRYA